VSDGGERICSSCGASLGTQADDGRFCGKCRAPIIAPEASPAEPRSQTRVEWLNAGEPKHARGRRRNTAVLAGSGVAMLIAATVLVVTLSPGQSRDASPPMSGTTSAPRPTRTSAFSRASTTGGVLSTTVALATAPLRSTTSARPRASKTTVTVARGVTTSTTRGVTTSTTTLPATSLASSTRVVPVPTTSLVSLGPEATGPDVGGIRKTLAAYFSAINDRNWVAAWEWFTPSEQAKLSQSQITSGSGTSHDSAVVLDEVTPEGGGTDVATVTFTSQQSPSESPNGQPCDQWALNYTMYLNPSGWLINAVEGASGTPYTSC
jgi:hypothetical protein